MRKLKLTTWRGCMVSEREREREDRQTGGMGMHLGKSKEASVTGTKGRVVEDVIHS